MSSLVLSIIVPAYNEQENIRPTLAAIMPRLRAEGIPFEMLVVNDNSHDRTADIVTEIMRTNPEVRLVNRTPPGGFGRAVRTGLAHFAGDAVVLVMADLSDDPADIVVYYRKLEEGYDCVFGSRFMRGSTVSEYPRGKLVVNRMVNRMLQILFGTRHNDLTNAFKAYRANVIRGIMPLYACHFNITIELSLSALIRGYRIASVPVNWYGRTWGQSNLRLRQMGRRYLATLLKIWFERLLILDDLLAEKNADRPGG